MVVKLCPKCNIVKSKNEFSIYTASKDGVRNYCKQCQTKISQVYYKKNKFKILQYQAQYRNTHVQKIKLRDKQYASKYREKLKLYQQQYKFKNKDKLRLSKQKYQIEYLKNNNNLINARRVQKKWRQNNLDKRRAALAKYRAFKINALPSTITKEELRQIQMLYKQARLLTQQTGIKYEIDHIIPLSKGGQHSINNLQILTAHDNRSKNNKIL